MNAKRTKRNALIFLFCLFCFGWFTKSVWKDSSPVPVLWKTDVGPYLDTRTPFVLNPDGGLLASTYSELLEMDKMGVLHTNITKGVHRLRFPRPVNVQSNGILIHTYYSQGALSSLRAQDSDGLELWQSQAFNLYRSAPPLVADNRFIYLNAGNKLLALSFSGIMEWSFTADAPLYRPASLGPDGAIYLISSGHLYCLNQEGSLQWDLRGSGWFGQPAVSRDGMIYVRGGSTNLTLTAINSGGNLAWTYSNANHHGVTDPVLGPDGNIHIMTTDSHLETINPDGSLKWKLQVGKYRSMQAPVVATDGTLFVASGDPKVTAIGPEGRVKWVFKVPKKGDYRLPKSWNGFRKSIKERFGFSKPILVSRPLLAPDGTLYVGFAQQYGSIYALSTEKEPFLVQVP